MTLKLAPLLEDSEFLQLELGLPLGMVIEVQDDGGGSIAGPSLLSAAHVGAGLTLRLWVRGRLRPRLRLRLRLRLTVRVRIRFGVRVVSVGIRWR